MKFLYHVIFLANFMKEVFKKQDPFFLSQVLEAELTMCAHIK